MKIFIIGGTGFLSSHVVEILLERGHDVTMFTRGNRENPFRKNGNLTWKRGDRNNIDELRETAEGKTYDAVYDFVAYEPESTQIAVDVFRGKVDRFIHCSTISVYMVSNEVRCPITEDQDKGPLMEFFPRNPFGMQYGIDKRKCEDILWDAHDENTFPVSMLRPTYISGPEDPAMRDYFWIQRILDGKPLLVPGSGHFAFQQVYVNDVARAFTDLLDYPESIGKAYNVAAEEIFSLNDYLRKLGTLLGKDPELFHVDQEVFDKLPFSVSPNGDVFTFNTRRTSVFSLDRIKRDLHFSSTPFEEWMLKTIRWFSEKYDGHSLGYENRAQEIEFAEHWKREKQKFTTNIQQKYIGDSTNE
ncbi:MAG: NAD-dependent epimerase/dehydratase family protein [Candidatus Marinimicrobia bacterium]|nr:NAD-dependent epimerase/dehydratase family protein [Candidatus Neomarinimicrobiota bacterium]MCF7880144.1 NAD-dependent epimerase/dehydratase family protein [Candidatus Neomarinimicrobiota bacterium]